MPQKPSQRDYKGRELAYESTPEQVHNRVLRNKARREAIKKGVVKKGDGMEIDHKKALDSGGTNAKGNLRAIPASRNRGYPRDAKNNPKGKA